MGFSFEVKESDLFGRIGSLKVSGKALETPYLFPVVHPVSQQVPTEELKAMGFGGLMTNSYILHSRRKEEALRDGIHKLLGFDGVFMTDSGGYQVLEYGNLDVDYSSIASFQSGIGSDIAVTLDWPTGYPQTSLLAKETVDYSLKNAKATMKEFGDSKTVWVGPIQGGLHLDLVQKSARALVEGGFHFLALGSPVQVMENYMFADLVRMIMAARSAVPYSAPLHLFGAGHPLTMALAVALGCDTFDSASYVMFARTGRYMTRGGVMTLRSMKYLPCSCPACSKTSVKALLELDQREMVKLLSVHNLFTLKAELDACKEAIVEGRLWDLVEERSMAHPMLREAFVELSRFSSALSAGTPIIKDKGLFIRSTEDLQRPEVQGTATRLRHAIRRSSNRAVIMIRDENRTRVEGKKTSKSPGAYDTYFLHSVFGPYPSELDFVYPFSQTEVGAVEYSISFAAATKTLKRWGYKTVRAAGASKNEPVKVTSRRNRRGASPSPRSSSARPR
ncbi:MAG TPA: tRNA guanosine(15) transglycosylase TgtA [Nitrososphaerales archaeon]|nr:tRNA guanosine(15) transglycosylase TgtA [Nitrososphaerales archaeon]